MSKGAALACVAAGIGALAYWGGALDAPLTVSETRILATIAIVGGLILWCLPETPDHG